MTGITAATVLAATNVHLRLRVRVAARLSFRSDSPRSMLGRQSRSARSVENRSVIIRSTSFSLFVSISLLSIALNEFFPECCQCPAEKRADGSRVQIQRGSQFLVAEIIAPEQQQFS